MYLFEKRNQKEEATEYHKKIYKKRKRNGKNTIMNFKEISLEFILNTE